MAREIERKFLLADDSWRIGVTGRSLFQTYIALQPECTVRVRIDGEQAFLTLKGLAKGAECLEFEYPVPFEDARAMVDAFAVVPGIEKTRYRVPFAGFVWEVDEFHGPNQGLVMAEIELTDQNEEFLRPGWLGPEVTGDVRYYNARLALEPYSGWGG